ncbi:MAG: 23S rRNA (pseudouridine(1915)-N(3))-methyltransferase RlmH [Hyphomicrobiales bacterium]
MRISILAIGQAKSAPEQALCDDYLRRLKHQGRGIGLTDSTCKLLPEAKRGSARQRKSDESDRLSAQVPVRAMRIVLSERGKQLTSEAFAEHIRRMLEQGESDLCFLIGGADGHAEELERDAGLLLSLGAMTWPHRLVRVMLLEQIYRAVTIIANHPYHRA